MAEPKDMKSLLKEALTSKKKATEKVINILEKQNRATVKAQIKPSEQKLDKA